MKFNSVCLITNHFTELKAFYEKVLIQPCVGDADFCFFKLNGLQLSLFSYNGVETFFKDYIDEIKSSSSFLEFEVIDVDAEYERLQSLNVNIIKKPTTQEWVIRSIWFKDIDNNIINFYCFVKVKDE